MEEMHTTNSIAGIGGILIILALVYLMHQMMFLQRRKRGQIQIAFDIKRLSFPVMCRVIPIIASGLLLLAIEYFISSH
jgi:hypothetical protein